jgi:peptide/nickel transport system permease protein
MIKSWPISLWLGGGITAIFCSLTLIGLIWAPYDVTSLDIGNRFQPPSSTHLLGTDQLGRDMVSMLMIGGQASIMVAILAVGLGAGLGVPLGLWAAAHHRGWVDDIIMRMNDLIFAFPALVLAILLTARFGPSAGNAIIAIGVFNIPVFARVARGAALPIWQLDYTLAARAAGKGKSRISRDHILPNIANLLIVQATIQFSLGILAEAALSYIGLGIQPPTPSWGRMLAEAQTLIYTHPMLAILPGLTIVSVVMGLNLLGDGLRDALDPRLNRGKHA